MTYEGDRLTVDFAELKGQVAHYLYGGGLDVTLNTTAPATDDASSFTSLQSAEKEVVKAVVRSGLRGFYNPPPLRKRKAHKWTFLEKTNVIALNPPYTNANSSTATYDHTGNANGENLIEITRFAATLGESDPAVITTATAHGFAVDEKVNLQEFALSAGDINGNALVKEVLSTTTFSIKETTAPFNDIDTDPPPSVTDSDGYVYKTLPDWAASGLLEISGVSYDIASVSGHRITLDASNNPGSDISPAAAFRIHQDDYILPDDFGRLIGPVTYVEKENSWHSVEIVGEGRIRELRQRDYIGTNSSKPQVAAIRVVNDGVSGDVHSGGTTDSTAGNMATLGTHKKIMFWPAVSGNYVLNYKYRLRPQDITGAGGDDQKFPYGASDHSETILYACLAEAERRLDERQGVYYQRFIESLASSIDLDSRTGKAHSLGYNGDGSDVGSVFGREYLFGSRIRHKNFSGTFTD